MSKERTIQKVKLNKYMLLWVMTFAAFTGVFFILLSKAATTAPTLGFFYTPSTASYTVGTQYTVQVMGNTTVPVQVMNALVKYDPTVLRVDDTQGTNGIDGSWQTKAGCGNSDQVPVAPYGPSDFGPCRPVGEAYFIVGNNLPNTLHPAGNNIVIGNFKFTVLKVPTGGTTTLTIDTNPSNTKMTNSVTTNAQTTLNGLQVAEGVYTISVASSGGGTNTGGGAVTGGSGTTTGNGTSPATPKNTTSTKKNTGGGSSSTTSGTTTPGDTTTPPADGTATQPVAATGTGSTDNNSNGDTAGKEPNAFSTPTLILASAALAGLIVGTTMLAFSEPVRHAVMGVGHMLHHTHPLPAGGPSGPVNVTSPINHIEPPKLNNPDMGSSPGNIVTPSEPPKSPEGE